MSGGEGVQVEALRALLSKTRHTAGLPWSVEQSRGGKAWSAWDVWGVRPDETIGDGEVVVAEVRGFEVNADLIVAAVNALPGLLDEIERLRATTERSPS